MPRITLTARKVDSLKGDPKGRFEYWDRSLPSFGLRVGETGKKTWVVLYRYRRRNRRLTLGRYPALSLADARDLARRALVQVAEGIDPAQVKLIARHTGKAFSDLAKEYLERWAKPKKKSWRNDKYLIDRELLPGWRNVSVQDISRRDVRALIEKIYDRGKKVYANRMLALINKMLNFAVERDWITDNPSKGMRRPFTERPRDRVLTAEELRKVWSAIEKEEPCFRALFQLRLLTAQRGGEVRQMRWSDIDFHTEWWTIPADRAKNGLAHRVPLNPQALDILIELQQWQGRRLREINQGRLKKKWPLKEASDWVFASSKGDGPIRWVQRVGDRLRQDSGVDFRPHDLRRTAASMMTASGTSRLVVKKILNHVDADITAVYDRFGYDNEKRVALDAWGRELQQILENKTRTIQLVAIASAKR